MELEESIQYIKSSGYCLWVGAGVSTYLSKGTEIEIPTWEKFVEELEVIKSIHKPTVTASLPERLEVVFANISNHEFKKQIRERILKQVAWALIKQAENNKESIPKPVKNLARLGLLANPIINFNVETLTSQLLLIGGGNYSIKTYGKKEINDNLTITQGGTDGNRFKRHIYHPHGDIDSYGVTVFTDEDYKRHKNSLAYSLATHSTYDEVLVIVGMSIEDQYLREQIANFRTEILDVVWYQVEKTLDPEIEKWCWLNRINLVTFQNWDKFWDQIETIFNTPSEEDLLLGWAQVVSKCIDIINDSFEAERRINNWEEHPFYSSHIALKEKIDYFNKGVDVYSVSNPKPIISEEERKKITGPIWNELKRKLNE